MPWFRQSTGCELGAIATILVVLIVFRFRALEFLSERFIGGYERDAGLYIWLLRSNISDLFTLPWFNTAAFYPYGASLAWSDNFILPSLAAYPLLTLGLPLVLSYNLIILAANFLTGYLTYRLSFRLTGKTLPSLTAGLTFMTYSFLTGHLGHPQLQFAFWIPLSIGLALAFLKERTVISSILLGLSISGCFLSAVYFSIFSVLAVGVLAFAMLLLRPSAFSKKDLVNFIEGIAIGLLPLIFVIFPYLAVQDTFEARKLYEFDAFAANIFSYFSAPVHNLLYGETSSFSHSEAQLFPGFVIYLLTIVAFFRLLGTKKLFLPSLLFVLSFVAAMAFSSLVAFDGSLSDKLTSVLLYVCLISFFFLLYRLGAMERALNFHSISNRDLIASFIGVALFFLTISFGPILVNGHGYAPFRLAYELIPGVSALRAVSRAGVVVVFALSIVIAITLSSKATSKFFGRSLCLLVCLLILVENYTPVFPIEAAVQAPKIFEDVKEVPMTDEGLLILPLAGELQRDGQVKSWGEYAKFNVNYMHWAFDTTKRLVNGYSGQRSKTIREFPRKMSGFPDQRSVNAMSTVAGLHYIIVVPEFFEDFEQSVFDKKLAEFSSDLSLIHRSSDGSMLIEYHGDILVREGYFLRVPSYPKKGKLEFSARGRGFKNAPEIELELYMDQHAVEKPFETISIKSSKDWSKYSVELPETSDRVRPLLIRFRPSQKGAKVFLRDTNYTW